LIKFNQPPPLFPTECCTHCQRRCRVQICDQTSLLKNAEAIPAGRCLVRYVCCVMVQDINCPAEFWPWRNADAQHEPKQRDSEERNTSSESSNYSRLTSESFSSSADQVLCREARSSLGRGVSALHDMQTIGDRFNDGKLRKC